MFGFGAIWQWAVAWNGLALYLVFRPSYRALELVFLFFLAVLSVSFLGCAILVGFDPGEVARGLVRMDMPGRQGVYDPWQVALAMIGAVGGSLMNLVYPYFLDAKGWRGPEYRRVQMYDFVLGVVAMLVLNLAVWVLGAELLYPDRPIEHLEDLPEPPEHRAGGIRPAPLLCGHLLRHLHVDHRPRRRAGWLGTHALLRWRGEPAPTATDFRGHPCYRWIAIWCLGPPLIWTLPGMPGFVALTLAANSAQVILLPLLAGGLWWITASDRLIGREHRNRWWENIVMGTLFVLAVYFAYQAVRSLA